MRKINNWLSIRAASKPDEPTELMIYDQIGTDWFGEGGVNAKDFAEALKGIPADGRIVVAINSPGGNVWDGLAIYNQLKRRKQYVTTRVDGVAASIASVIALAGQTVEMPENSLMMIHEAAGIEAGNAEQMRAMADRLDQHSDLLAGIYAEKTGNSRAKMRELMRAETWFTGSEALAIGLADTAIEQVKLAANFNYSGFRRVPAILGTTTKPPPSAAGAKANLMQKDKIFALLKQHGKELPEGATDETILTALADLVTNNKVTQDEADKLKKKSPDVIINADELKRLADGLARERELRLTNEFRAIQADRPYLKDTELAKVLNDESLLATFRAMPIAAPGVDPVRYQVQNNGNSIVENYRRMKPGKERLDFALANWNGLQEAHDSAHIMAVSSLPVGEQLRRLHSPRAVNTYGASLVTDRLADNVITTIGVKLAALRGFSVDFGTDRLKPRANVQVPKCTAGSSTQTNPTTFETGGSTTTNVQVSVAYIDQPFSATNDELHKGHTLMRVAGKNAQNFANALSDIWTALLTVGNYGAATAIGVAATFDPTDLPAIYALAKNYGAKNLILDGGHLAYLLPTDKFKFRIGEEGAFGFDLIAEQNRWTGAVANTVGFICDPNAIAVASGLPLALPASEFIELNTVEVPMLGLTVQLCHWFSRAGREHWMSYDVMFGAAAGDTTAAEVLVTA